MIRSPTRNSFRCTNKRVKKSTIFCSLIGRRRSIDSDVVSINFYRCPQTLASMATRVEDLVQTTPANAQVKIPSKKERLPGAWRIKLVEDLLVAYPDLDRNMINIAIDFDAAQAEKFGADYDPEDHVKEIFPKRS